MLPDRKRKFSNFVGLSILLILGVGLIPDAPDGSPMAILKTLAVLVAVVFWYIGWANYSRGKGHSGAWSIITTIPFFVLFLVCMRDRNPVRKENPPPPPPIPNRS